MPDPDRIKPVTCHSWTSLHMTRSRRDSTRREVHMTSRSSTHQNFQKQYKPANKVLIVLPLNHNVGPGATKASRGSRATCHSHALDNTLPNSRGRLTFVSLLCKTSQLLFHRYHFSASLSVIFKRKGDICQSASRNTFTDNIQGLT